MEKWKREAIEKLAVRRRAAGLTQVAAAERAEVSQSYWAEVETGKKDPLYDTLKRMCQAVGIPWQDAKTK